MLYKRGSYFSKDFSTQGLALDCETPTFIVGEPNPFALQLRFENLVLFLDVRNHVELMPVDPARQGYEKKLPRLNSIHVSYFTDKNAGS